MNRLHDPIEALVGLDPPSPNGQKGTDTAPPKRSAGNARPTAPIGNGSNGDMPWSPPPTTPANGREANGRFARGNPGGPGNPFARQSAALRKRIQAKLSDEKLDKIVDVLIGQAEKGNVAAAKLLLSYGIGQPTPAADPDSLDLEEWKVLRQQVKVRDVGEFLNTFPIDEMCEFLHELKPIRSNQWKKPLRRMFTEEGWVDPQRYAGLPGGPPIANGPNGGDPKTPRDKAARRKKLKKKYAIKRGKLVEQSD